MLVSLGTALRFRKFLCYAGFTMGVMLVIYYLWTFCAYPNFLTIQNLFGFIASFILTVISYSELFFVELLAKADKSQPRSLEKLAKAYNLKFVVRSISFLFGSTLSVWILLYLLRETLHLYVVTFFVVLLLIVILNEKFVRKVFEK